MTRLALTVEAVVVFGLFLVLHRIVPFKTVARIMGWKVGPAPHAGPRNDHQVATVSGAVFAVSRTTKLDDCCLAESIAIKWMLARRRIATNICFGIRIKGSALHSPKSDVLDHIGPHAWIQIGDAPLRATDPEQHVLVGCYH